jgi:3-methyladenine DNA glycosylase AlkD
VAIIATHWFIRRVSFADTFAITELLLLDTEDLIHKAAGWMLREVASRDRPEAEAFLRRHEERHSHRAEHETRDKNDRKVKHGRHCDRSGLGALIVPQ